MTESLIKLENSLTKGFLNNSYPADEWLVPDILINDSVNGIKVLNTLTNKLDDCEEFLFSTAFITTSGVASLFNVLDRLKSKGIKGKILTSKYLNFTQPEALERIIENFPNIDLRIQETGNLHAKAYIFKKESVYDIIVGSSNLTSDALSVNNEWNLKVSSHTNGHLTSRILDVFRNDFNHATPVTIAWLENYKEAYQLKRFQNYKEEELLKNPVNAKPNRMQSIALENLRKLRDRGANKALLISATGTGKTYLSAFDVKQFNPNRCLFVVHRRNIAEAALRTFNNVFGNSKKMGLYSGDLKEINSDFIFTTVQTMSLDHHLNNFSKDYFDYIIIDETHRAGGATYKKLLEYFNPKFLLGMTATPERTDGFDIFNLFDHNIAYEIRLHKAMEEDMLSEFHYYGVQDISVDGKIIDENSDFRYLEAEERVKHIIGTSKKYGTDDGIIRGLVFCSRKDECKSLSESFNRQGFRTVALTGDNDESSRTKAIERLESDSPDKLDYIFTVDIFNEGIDIPRVNQILMLRPTSSAIIFIQQLGRGLRKFPGKSYVTVIDFIGNYQNNYLVPIALYGDSTYNKDTLRKLLSSGSKLIPGGSTINFDEITKEQIFRSIDSSNIQTKKDLTKDYDLLKFKIGRSPLMMDFLNHGSRDPFQYVEYSKHSFFEFVSKKEKDLTGLISGRELDLLKYFSKEINNAKRIEESIILELLIDKEITSFNEVSEVINKLFGYNISLETFESALNNLSLNFITENSKGKLLKVAEIYSFDIIQSFGNKVTLGKDLQIALENEIFINYLKDSIYYSIQTFKTQFDLSKFTGGFVRFKKYSRKDCFRILNWEQQPLAQNVGGYMFHPHNLNCPIFLNYHKEEGISETTQYEDGFIDPKTLIYMSKSKRTLNSPDVLRFMQAKEKNIRLPLFIKKENAEGDDFYYTGEVIPVVDEFEETTMGKEKTVSVVKMKFELDKPVEDSIYRYLIG